MLHCLASWRLPRLSSWPTALPLPVQLVKIACNAGVMAPGHSGGWVEATASIVFDQMKQDLWMNRCSRAMDSIELKRTFSVRFVSGPWSLEGPLPSASMCWPRSVPLLAVAGWAHCSSGPEWSRRILSALLGQIFEICVLAMAILDLQAVACWKRTSRAISLYWISHTQKNKKQRQFT